MKDVKQLLAEQREEALTGIADGLRAGGVFKDIMRDAATYGVKPEQSASFKELLHDEEQRPGEVIARMTPEERVKGFHALLGSNMSSMVELEDADGEYRTWGELSSAGKLGVIANDAAYYDVPFEVFAATAIEHVDPDAMLDASLRVSFRNQQELTAISRALPGHDRIESYPLVDQVQDLRAELEHAEGFIRRQEQGRGMER